MKLCIISLQNIHFIMCVYYLFLYHLCLLCFAITVPIVLLNYLLSFGICLQFPYLLLYSAPLLGSIAFVLFACLSEHVIQALF